MLKGKKIIVIIALIMVSIFSTMLLTSCGDSYDSDDDGLSDSFEEDIGTDPDGYTWNDDVDWDQAAENYDGD